MQADLERQLRARIETLEDELSAARARLRALKDPNADHLALVSDLQARYGLTMVQARMLALTLAKPGVLTKQRLYDLLYGDCYDGGPDIKTLDVHLCYLRKALAAHGGKIVCPRGGTFTVCGLEGTPQIARVAPELPELRRTLAVALGRRAASASVLSRRRKLPTVAVIEALQSLQTDRWVVRQRQPRVRQVVWALTPYGRAALDKELQALSKSVESEHQKAA